MRLLDFHCTGCDRTFEFLIRDSAPVAICPHCGDAKSERILVAPSHYTQDTVPGGFTIENLDPTPRYFESKSAYQKELKARGLTNDRYHSTNPRGPYSTKW